MRPTPRLRFFTSASISKIFQNSRPLLVSFAGHGQCNLHSFHNIPSLCQKSEPLSSPGGTKAEASSQDGVSAAAAKPLSIFLRDPIALRDACRCPLCVDPSTKQRKFSTVHIPLSIEPISLEQGRSGVLAVRWENDIDGYPLDHVSTFSQKDLQGLGSTSQDFAVARAPPLWDVEEFQKRGLWIKYDKYRNDPDSLGEALSALRRDGLIFITHVPNETEAVGNIAECIGPLRNTFYGPAWDVRSVPKSKNVAYTNDDLRFHMDLLYMTNPPGYQFLHFVSNTCHGGESQFADAFNAAERLFQSDRGAYDILCRHPMEWTYQNDSQFYRQARPTFQEYPDVPAPAHQSSRRSSAPRLQYVNWSPPFQGRLHHDVGYPEEIRKLILALRAYDRILNRKDMVLELKAKPGTCAVFENRRIVHARRAFTLDSGERLLRGTYVDEDAFLSRCRVLGID